MNKVKTLIGWMTIICFVHVIEQLIFGIDELYELRNFIGKALSLFSNPDYGTVVLVMVGTVLFLSLMYMMEARGRARVVAVSFLAVMCLVESHHIIKTVLHANYFPGAATALPFVVTGILMIHALRRESRNAELVAAAAA